MISPGLKQQTVQESTSFAARAEAYADGPDLVTLCLRLLPTVCAATIGVFAILLHHPLTGAAALLSGVGISVYLTLSVRTDAPVAVTYVPEKPADDWIRARGVNERMALALHRASRRRPANEDSSRACSRRPTFFD